MSLMLNALKRIEAKQASARAAAYAAAAPAELPEGFYPTPSSSAVFTPTVRRRPSRCMKTLRTLAGRFSITPCRCQ